MYFPSNYNMFETCFRHFWEPILDILLMHLSYWKLVVSTIQSHYTTGPGINSSTFSNSILSSLYFKAQGAFSKIDVKYLNGDNDSALLALQLFNAALIVLLRSCTLPARFSLRHLEAVFAWNRWTPSFLRRFLSTEVLQKD